MKEGYNMNSIQHHASAVRIGNQLNQTSNVNQGLLQKLATGSNLNHAKDNPSAYSIAMSMSAQVRMLSQANQNMQTSSSMLSVAGGALDSTSEALASIQEKLISAANGTNNSSDRSMIQEQINQLIDQIDDNASTTFNDKKLIDGSLSGANGMNIQGVTSSEGTFSIRNMTAKGLGLVGADGESKVQVSSSEGLSAALALVDMAMKATNEEQAKVGAKQQALQYSSNNYTTTEANTIGAQSTIQDADIAKTAMQMYQNNILSQSNVLMMVQSNQNSAGALALLR